jgi:serine/threonine-protein kinase
MAGSVPKLPTPEEAVPPGTVLLGKYRVDSILGTGGMGMVTAATHLGLDERVAIKMLRPDVIADAETCSRFLREAQAAVKLKSEHVARVADVGTLASGAPYMVMEFLEGLDLDQMLAASGPVAPELAVDFVLQGCEGLAEAHALGIVHRDLKPSNFFVTWRADGSPLVKVLDFGISKSPLGIDLSLTQTQSMLGTPAYMSPEQMRSARRVDARTDLWSLGALLYELIEGRRPFVAESFSEMCVKVAADPPDPMVAPMPDGLAAVILRCLEKQPDDRYQSIAELAAALARFAREPREAALRVERIRRTLALRPRLATPPPAATTAPPAPAPAAAAAAPAFEEALTVPRPPRRRLGLILAVAALVVAAGFAVGLLATRDGAAPAAAPAAAPDAAAAPAPAVDAAMPAAAVDAAVEEATPEAAPAPRPKPTRKQKKPKRRKPARTGADTDDVFGKRK